MRKVRFDNEIMELFMKFEKMQTQEEIIAEIKRTNDNPSTYN